MLKFSRYRFFGDFNGDGLVDVVAANDGGFTIAFGKPNYQFSSLYKAYDILPELSRDGLYVDAFDIDGNGVTDLIWTNQYRDYFYYSFVDTRPNLLKQVDNGLGDIIKISYGLSSEYLNFENPTHKTSIVVPVVKEVERTTLSASNILHKRNFDYQSPFYDGVLNEFRGFKERNVLDYGDESRPASRAQTVYHLGENAYHLKGQVLSTAVYTVPVESFVSEELMMGETSTFEAQETFDSLDDDWPVKIPLPTKRIYIEGDDDALTSHRIREDELSYTFSGAFLDTIEVKERDASESLYRIKRRKYAQSLTGRGTNRVCESRLLDNAESLIEHRRFYFDSENLCELTRGLMTLEQIYDGTSFETKRSLVYNAQGNIIETYDARSNKIEYSYDSYGINLASIKNPLNHIVLASYDNELGVLTELTDQNNLTTTISYDLLLRPLRVIGPMDSLTYPTIQYEYTFGSAETFGSVKTSKRETSGQAGVFETINYFDALGRPIYEVSEGEEAGKFRQIRKDYNSKGLIYRQYVPVFVTGLLYDDESTQNGYERTLYDELDRVRFLEKPQFPQVPDAYREIKYQVGIETHYDELRNTNTIQRDEFQRQVLVTDAHNEVNSYAWSLQDKLSSIVDPQFSVTSFVYDSQGRRTCKQDPNLGVTQYVYNEDNLLIEKLIYGYQNTGTCASPVGTPRSVETAYDALKRKTKIEYPISAGMDDILFNYDEVAGVYGVGRLTSVDYGHGTKSFEYDHQGLIAKEIQVTTSGTYTTLFEYDALQRLAKIIYPTIGSRSLEVNYGFSNAGNINQVSAITSGALPLIDNVFYNELSQIEKILRSNEIEDRLVYNDSSKSFRLSEVHVVHVDSMSVETELFKHLYTFDETENLIERQNPLLSELENFSYDDLHRLTNYSLNSASLRAYQFDEIGNITQKTENTTNLSYVYDSSRKQILESVDSSSYAFDDFGNILSDGNRSFVFDWDNRLKSLTMSSVATNYRYDHEGLRTEKENTSLHHLYLNKYTEVRDGSPVYHVFMGNKRVASFDSSGDLSHIHQDHLGSTALRTDDSGAVSYAQRYFPFGEERSSTGSLLGLFDLFTDQYRDEESDLYYYQQRYYSQKLGRFVSADPLFAEQMDELGLGTQKVNLYSYVENNPLKFTDPTGEHPVLIGLAYAGAVNATAMIGAWTAGVGAIKLNEVATGNSGAQNMENLNKAINVGIGAGFTPVAGAAAVVGTGAVGTAVVNATSSAYGTASVWVASNPVGADIALGVEGLIQGLLKVFDGYGEVSSTSASQTEVTSGVELTIEQSNFQSRENLK